MDDRRMLDRIAAGRTDLVFDWLDGGGSPAAIVDGSGILAWCAYYGDVSALRRLLQAGASLSSLGDNLGLSGAAFHGHWQLCEFLLEQGADPDWVDPDNGETALHAALCSPPSVRHQQVTRVLLARHADPNRLTRAGAQTGGFMRDVRLRGEAPLHRAAAYGTVETIAMLLAAGAKVDQRDAAGDSPLSWASWALRETRVLNLLAFDGFSVRPDRTSMEDYLVGHPLPPRG